MAPRGGAAGNRGWARPMAGATLLVIVALLPGIATAAPAAPGHPNASNVSSIYRIPQAESVAGMAPGGTGTSPPAPASMNLTVGSTSWSMASAGSSAPPGPYTSIVYDPEAAAFVAFGGEPNVGGKSATYSNQTWLFAEGHWSQGCDSEEPSQACGPTPPGRAGALLVYDPITQTVVMTGGFGETPNGVGQTFRDLWTYSGTMWSNASASTPPEGLWDGAMVYDPATRSVVGVTDVGTTWSYAGGNWSKMNSLQSPPARTHPALFYDPVRQAAILYGGVGSTGRTFNDTWAFGSSGWSKLDVGSTAPTSREAVSQVHPLPTPIPAAFDSVRGAGIVVGPAGDGGNSTWLFVGDSWENVTSQLGTSLPDAAGASLAYDAVGGYGVLLEDAVGSSRSITYYFSDPFRVATGLLAQTLDVNQSATWSPTLSAGLPPYETQMILGENHCTLAGPVTTGPVATCPEGSNGLDNVSLQFTDFAGRVAVVNYSLTVHADPTLVVAGVHPDPTSVGVPVTYSARPGLGTAPYGSMTWTFDDGAVVHGSGPAHTFNASGPHEVTVSMVDGVGYPVTAHYTVDVNLGPTAALAVNQTETDPDLPVQFNATVIGGTGTDTCAWVFGDGSTSSDCSPVHAYPTDGRYAARFWTNDSVGATGGGNLSVEVAPRLAAALGSIAPAYAGQPVGLSAVGNGGVAPYRVVWSFGDGGTATGPTVQHAYGQAGTYQTEATITDAVGGRSSVAATITVAVDGGSLLGAPGGHLTTPSPSGSIHVPLEIRSATAPSTTPALLAELLGAVVLAALALFLDRGRRGPGPGPSAGWMTRLGRRARRALRPDRRRAR